MATFGVECLVFQTARNRNHASAHAVRWICRRPFAGPGRRWP